MTDTIQIDPRRYYTTAQYAEVAGCSQVTAIRRCRDGLIPGAVKPHGGGWRIPGTALLAFVVQDTPTTRATVKVPGMKPSERAEANAKITHTRGK